MDNGTFLKTYKTLIEAVDHLGGDFGVHRPFIEKQVKDDGLDPKDSALYETHKKESKEEFIAKHFILKADPKQFGTRVAALPNDYVSGKDMNPKTLTKAYDMVVNYVNPNKRKGAESNDLGMSFYQQGDSSQTGRGRGRTGRGGGRDPGRGRGRGNGGGRGTHGPPQSGDDDDNDYNYELEEEEQEIGGQRNNATNNRASSYPCVSTCSSSSGSCFNIRAAEDIVLQHNSLPDRWLLLDSCFTMDVVSNRELLHDIHVAHHPIWVRCNAGRIQLKQQGYLGDYPYPVWYNPKGAANILSLNNVSNHYRVTMDTDHHKALVVHRRDGSTITFCPTNSGLYKHELPSALSVCDMWTMISTVSDRAANYSKREYQRALLARRLQNIIMRPSTRQYQDNIIRELQDCPITKRDVQAKSRRIERQDCAPP